MKVDYDPLAKDYQQFRIPDPRIQTAIWNHLGDSQRVLNVGAGIGSYEPRHCEVVAIEPSRQMLAQRSNSNAQLVNGCAEQLPFRDNTFDLSMALLTIHHWRDIRQGLMEMLRVTRNKIIIFTWIGYHSDFWLNDYIPEIKHIDDHLFPPLDELETVLGTCSVETVEIPHDCSDGFMCAYWRRPEAYLDSGIRKAISTFSRMGELKQPLAALNRDLDSEQWHKRYGHLLDKRSMDFGYRLVICNKSSHVMSSNGH